MPTKRPVIVRTLVVVAGMAFLSLLLRAPAKACMICVPFPKTTLADSLIKSESIVTVREHVEKPYVFTLMEVLKGTCDDHEIEAFVDSASRRKLKRNPEDVILLARNTTDGEWKHLTYADTERLGFIRAILEHSDQWNGLKGSEKRITFFTDYLTHNDGVFREQAYLEVGRAPYAVIKTIAGSVPRDQIRRYLANWRLVEWHSLYILMLGQSRHADDHDFIRNKFETAAKFGLKTNLSAWSTAYIEINPETGLEEIETLYFGRSDRTREELEEIQKGLSVLGSEGGSLAKPRVAERRRRIVTSYAILLEQHPTMAGKVANDLTNWQIRALVDQMSSIKKNDATLDPESKLAVSYYLSMAPRFPSVK